MNTTETLPTVECYAHVDRVIQARSTQGTLCCGPVAQWKDGSIVRVMGRFRSRGWTNAVFNAQGCQIRWRTDGKTTGWFSKGIVDIFDNPHTELPIVK